MRFAFGCRRKTTICAKEGAHSYIEAAERLNVPGQWTWSVECYRRGLSLAAKLGRKKDLFKTAVARVQQAARNAATDSEQFRCCYFLEILRSNTRVATLLNSLKSQPDKPKTQPTLATSMPLAITAKLKLNFTNYPGTQQQKSPRVLQQRKHMS